MLQCLTRYTLFRHVVSFVIIAFVGMIPAQGYAQVAVTMPAPDQMMQPTARLEPARMLGLRVDPVNPFNFYFIMDQGEKPMADDVKKHEFTRLIKYFMASLTTPNQDMWVNLSPVESNRIIPDNFIQTEMGRDLLSQDYVLKQFTSSLMYPEKGIGKEFWQKVYAQAYQKFGTTDIPVDTFNKVWIMADRADIYQKDDTALLVNSHLKVMLERDFMMIDKNAQQFGNVNVSDAAEMTEAQRMTADVIREVIVPAIEKEVNEGESFALLRQIYTAEIMATWFKKTLKESLLGQVYADQSKVAGIELNDPQAKERIYEQYLKAYKVGVFNYIKEEVDENTQELLPRKYFSGGMTSFDGAMLGVADAAQAGSFFKRMFNKIVIVAATLAALSSFGDMPTVFAAPANLQYANLMMLIDGIEMQQKIGVSERVLEKKYESLKIELSQAFSSRADFTPDEIQKISEAIGRIEKNGRSSVLTKDAIDTLLKVNQRQENVASPVVVKNTVPLAANKTSAVMTKDVNQKAGVAVKAEKKSDVTASSVENAKPSMVKGSNKTAWQERVDNFNKFLKFSKAYPKATARAAGRFVVNKYLKPAAKNIKNAKRIFEGKIKGSPYLLPEGGTWTIDVTGVSDKKVASGLPNKNSKDYDSTPPVENESPEILAFKEYMKSFPERIRMSQEAVRQLEAEFESKRKAFDKYVASLEVQPTEEQKKNPESLLAFLLSLTLPAGLGLREQEELVFFIASLKGFMTQKKALVKEMEEFRQKLGDSRMREIAQKTLFAIQVGVLKDVAKALAREDASPVNAMVLVTTEIDKIESFSEEERSMAKGVFSYLLNVPLEARKELLKGDRGGWFVRRLKAEAGVAVEEINAKNKIVYRMRRDIAMALKNSVMLSDAAAVVEAAGKPVGGINLNSEHMTINIKVDGNGMPLPVQFQDPAMSNIPGLSPIIREIVPMNRAMLPALSDLFDGKEDQA